MKTLIALFLSLSFCAYAQNPLETYMAELLVAAQTPSFSFEAGQEFYSRKQSGGNPQTPSCATCHGPNPKQNGENVKTGKIIEPLAPVANPKRLTNREEIEKWFQRNCKDVLGRTCSPIEKGNFLTFISKQ